MATPKTNSQRDYKAEYQRRIARGRAKGLSKSQARGHPKANEKSVRKPRPINDESLQISLRALRSGSSLADAAKQINVSPARLRNQAKAAGVIRKQRGRWVVKKTLPRQMLVYSEAKEIKITVRQYREASKLGRYMAAVGRFLESNNIDELKRFVGKSVKDADGTSHPFETNPNALYRIAASGSETFEQIYRIVI